MRHRTASVRVYLRQREEKQAVAEAMPGLDVAPALSTPDTHAFEDHAATELDVQAHPRLSDEQLLVTYEIQRTVEEIRAGKRKRIALQFPDHMLPDAPRVFTALSRGLKQARKDVTRGAEASVVLSDSSAVNETSNSISEINLSSSGTASAPETLYILADTSYGACCVDEVAAEHADADVVVHYGRSCLSPTARLPVIYVFTKPSLDIPALVASFKQTYSGLHERIIIMADIPYAAYVREVTSRLQQEGYTELFETNIIHDTASPLPNRTVPNDVTQNVRTLQDYQLFHISNPPESLLLILASRVGSINVYATTVSDASNGLSTAVSSARVLRRRYALLTSITTVPIFGILINTLSVKNYMHILAHVKKMIADAGKKSYVFVVGKVNAAKVANFAEVGAWVVIGCWESSLFDSKDFWKPIITPFELELALKSDEERLWTGQWTSDFGTVLKEAQKREEGEKMEANKDDADDAKMMEQNSDVPEGDVDSEEESEPPEFDLRTGRYVSHSRPMNPSARSSKSQNSLNGASESSSDFTKSLVKRANGDLAIVGNGVSPAAEFFREKRSWQGLGSDQELTYDGEAADAETKDGRAGTVVEQGRVGIARGYVVGEGTTRR